MPARSAWCQSQWRSTTDSSRSTIFDVELVNYSGLDRPIAGGDRDRQERRGARHGVALAEAAGAGGFDVKIAGWNPWRLHARTVAHQFRRRQTDPTSKAKVVAVGDLGGPDKNFFSIQLAKQGIDPNRDVDWRAYPGNLLQLAVEKGEVQGVPGLGSDRPYLAEG